MNGDMFIQCSAIAYRPAKTNPSLNGWLDAQVFKGAKRCLAALGRANHQAALQQIGLIDILERTRVLAHRAGKGRQAHGTAGERLGKRLQDANIHPVQTKLINLEELERLTANIKLNRTVAAHLRKVAHTLEQTVGQARRAQSKSGGSAG